MNSAHSFALVIASSLVLAGCLSTSSELAPVSSIQGVAAEGTLADHVLARDASLEIRKIMGGNKRVTKFVIQQPVGTPGRKAWREMWVYDLVGASQGFLMTFREDGEGSVDFEIRKMHGNIGAIKPR